MVDAKKSNFEWKKLDSFKTSKYEIPFQRDCVAAAMSERWLEVMKQTILCLKI